MLRKVIISTFMALNVFEDNLRSTILKKSSDLFRTKTLQLPMMPYTYNIAFSDPKIYMKENIQCLL